MTDERIPFASPEEFVLTNTLNVGTPEDPVYVNVPEFEQPVTEIPAKESK